MSVRKEGKTITFTSVKLINVVTAAFMQNDKLC